MTQIVPLASLVTVVGGGTPSRKIARYFGGDIPWITPKDMKSWYIDGAQVTITEAGLASSPCSLIPAGSVLMVVRSGILKHTIPLAINKVPVTVNQDMKAMICGSAILPEYLARFLKANERNLLGLVRGTTADNIPFEAIKRYPIVVPSLAEQKRIADILDKADALREKRRRAIEQLDHLWRSVFIDQFGDPSVNSKNLPRRQIGELTRVATGTTPSRSVDGYYGGHIPWVKTTEVHGNLIKSTGEHLTESGKRAGRCRLYPIGSIIVAMYGQGKTRGQSAILGIEACTNQACAVILPSEKIMTEYLFAYLQIAYESLRSLGRGGNQPNLNLQLVSGFEVMVPEIEQQTRFAQIYNTVMALQYKEQHAMELSEQLFKSAQVAAFTGTLSLIHKLDELDQCLTSPS